MKNGTNQAVLLRDLMGGEGPFVSLADDFVERRCTRCRAVAADEVRFHDRLYLCAACWQAVVRP